MSLLKMMQWGFLAVLLFMVVTAPQYLNNPVILEKLVLCTGITILLLVLKLRTPQILKKNSSQNRVNQ